MFPTCGLLSEMGTTGSLDDPAAFFEPDRIQARVCRIPFPKRAIPQTCLECLEVSFEACSEAPLFIEIFINILLGSSALAQGNHPLRFHTYPGRR
jgi:predicted transcriptional regulator